MSRLNVTEKIITARISQGLTWAGVAEKVGLSKEWVTAACLGQMALSSEQASIVGDIFGLTVDERQWLMVPPYRGSLPTSVPTDPLVYRFHAEGGTLTADDKAALAATLDSSVRAMAAAFELADFGPWRAIIESVLYEGLYAVGAAVLNGTFRKGHKRKQRKAGA